jgi:archaellum component FlaF (FlaF/FlaG flagellin family)
MDDSIRVLMSHMKLLVAALVLLVNVISTAHAAPPQKVGTATSNGARFINPKQDQIFHPGDTVSISFDLDPKIEKLVKAIAIISSMGDFQFREARPYSFTIAVPGKELRGGSNSLIGFQELHLSGVLVGQEKNTDDLATTTIDVEEPDQPVSLEVVGPLQPIHNRLAFVGLGEDTRIAIYARFPDGHESEVTNSTYLSISSENPAIAFVVDNETVVSVEPGQTRIIVTYTIGHQQKQILVPVTVENWSPGVDVSPAFFNFGDVRSNTVSKPLQVTVTNHTQENVHIYKLDPRPGGFSVGPENCSDTILPASGSCTITVRFVPISTGPAYGPIFVSNDQSGIGGVFLLGNGI